MCVLLKLLKILSAAPATYFFFAGLVLVPLSMPFLDSYDEPPEHLMALLNTARRVHKVIINRFILFFVFCLMTCLMLGRRAGGAVDRDRRRTHSGNGGSRGKKSLSFACVTDFLVLFLNQKGSVLKTINGEKVLNLKHAFELLTNKVN